MGDSTLKKLLPFVNRIFSNAVVTWSTLRLGHHVIFSLISIVIIISEFLGRHSKAKRTRAPVIHERCGESKGLS